MGTNYLATRDAQGISFCAQQECDLSDSNGHIRIGNVDLGLASRMLHKDLDLIPIDLDMVHVNLEWDGESLRARRLRALVLLIFH